MTVKDAAEGVKELVDNIRSIVFIDEKKLEYIIAAKLAGGHVILADFHGVGKTSLARALAGSIIWERGDSFNDGVIIDEFSRIQCTVDLLPQDILGYSRFTSASEDLVFVKGPIFAHFVLCDEINLLTPKTQGSFFQAMEEKTVTVEGKTYTLPDPFFIIATMNLEGVHLFPLPAPQLDRFMIRISLGFPPPSVESKIIAMHGQLDSWKDFHPVIPSSRLLAWQQLVDSVFIHQDIITYIVACVGRTRTSSDVAMCASPRAGIKISRLARAISLLRGEDFVSLDTVKEIFIPSMAHRIAMKNSQDTTEDYLQHVLDTEPVETKKLSEVL